MFGFFSRPAPAVTSEDLRKIVSTADESIAKLHSAFVAGQIAQYKIFLHTAKACPGFAEWARFNGQILGTPDLTVFKSRSGILRVFDPEFSEPTELTPVEATSLALTAAEELAKELALEKPTVAGSTLDRFRVIASSNWAELPWVKIAAPAVAGSAPVVVEEPAKVEESIPSPATPDAEVLPPLGVAAPAESTEACVDCDEC